MNPLRPVENPVPNTLFDRLVVATAVFLGIFGFATVVIVLRTVPAIGTADAIPTVHKLALWIYLAAHGTTFHVTTSGETVVYPIRLLPGWQDWYRLWPPVVLFLGGFQLARTAPIANDLRGFLDGASVTVVLAPLAVCLGLLSIHTQPLPAHLLPAGVRVGPLFDLSPDGIEALVLAGVVYPIVFAGLGGVSVPVLERHLDRVERGPLYRLDRAFSTLSERWTASRWAESRLTSTPGIVRAGAFLALAQLPGFALTHYVFQVQSKFAVRSPFNGGRFPLDGYLLFLAAALAISTVLWWALNATRRVSGSDGFTIGLVIGFLVHLTVWGVGYLLSAGPTGAIPPVVGFLSFVAITYALGWVQSLGAGWMGLLLAQRRIETGLFRN